MENIVVSKESKLKQLLKSPEVRSSAISVFGKVFHIIISNGNESLEETSKKYLERTGVDLNVEGDKDLENFKVNDNGIIIANHISGNFADYLPIFAELGDEILKKSVFYTGAFNKRMNEREFPDYTFRAATLEKKEDIKELTKNIEKDIEKVKNDGGYIFIIPAGANTDNNAEFKSIFKRIVDGLDDNISVLSSKVLHNWDANYKNILLKKGAETKIIFKNMEIGDYKGKNGKEMREIFNNS